MIQMNILNKHTFQTFAQSLNAKTRYFLTTWIWLLSTSTHNMDKTHCFNFWIAFDGDGQPFSTFHFLHLVDLRYFAAVDRWGKGLTSMTWKAPGTSLSWLRNVHFENWCGYNNMHSMESMRRKHFVYISLTVEKRDTMPFKPQELL